MRRAPRSPGAWLRSPSRHADRAARELSGRAGSRSAGTCAPRERRTAAAVPVSRRIVGKLDRGSDGASRARSGGLQARRSPSARLASLRAMRVPKALRPRFDEICALTDRFCAERLDAEYAELCRKLVAKLARKRPSPLERGDPRIWAAAALYTVGSLNFIFDREQELHMSGDELSALTGIPKSTMANKAKAIRDLLGPHRLDPELCRRVRLGGAAGASEAGQGGRLAGSRMRRRYRPAGRASVGRSLRGSARGARCRARR